MMNPTNANASLAGEANAESADMGGLRDERSTAKNSPCEVAYSRGANKFDNTPAQHTAPDFAAFRDAILADRADAKGRQYIAAPCALDPALGGQPHRNKACALPRRFIGLDVDGSTPEAFAAAVLHLQRYSGLVYTTASHTPAAPRFRVVLELDMPAPRAELMAASSAIRARIDAALAEDGHAALPWDASCDRPEQPLYLPLAGAQAYVMDGMPLVLGELLADMPPPPAQDAPQAPPTATSGAPTAWALGALDRACRAVATAPEGERNDVLNRESHSMGGFVPTGQLSQSLAETALFDATRRAGYATPDIDLKKIRDGIASGMLKPRTDGLPAVAANDAPAPAVRNAADLLTRDFAPVQWGIRGILPEGISILSGDPKIGKSWLLYQACIAVATGKPLWHGREPEEQGDALMLALEDNDRRLQRRLQTLLPRFCSTSGRRFNYPTVDRLHYATEWPRAEKGVAQLAQWLRDHPRTRLVVIDTVSAFRDPEPGRKSAYATDYAVGAMLKPLTTEFSCAVVLVMHNRKQHSEDALQLVSGTQGMTGGVDNVLVLRRERGKMDAGLYVDGRDIEEPQEVAMHFNDGYWSSEGQSVDDARMSRERRDVLRVVAELGEGAKVRAIADALPAKKLASVKSMLSKMVRAGSLRLTDGVYVVPEWEPGTGTGTDPGTAEAA